MQNGYELYEYKKAKKWAVNHFDKAYKGLARGFAQVIVSTKETATEPVSYLEACQHLMVSNQEELDKAAHANKTDEVWPMEWYNNLLRAACYELIKGGKGLK